ncbi:MAG: hypothetical protein II225_02570 [Ruminococcus sp.]|nr:hypothetical protein [Ruminococcus sp.]
MTNLKKIMSVFLAVLLVLSLGACSDLPKTSSAQWSYKYADNEYAIGVHIYSLFTAYSKAYNIVSEAQGESFDTSASIMDVESTFDETSGVMVCRDWINAEADRITKSIVGLDMMMEKYDMVLEGELYDAAKDQARKDWYLGPYYEEYSSYGSSTTPYKEVLEPYGISFDSFFVSTYLASAKQSAVFSKLYNKGGVEEIPEETVHSYFEENYTSYGCFTVNFYDSQTDSETGQMVNIPFEIEKTKALKEDLEYYVKMIENGISFSTIGGVYAAEAGLEHDPSYQNIEIVKDGISDSLPDEAVEALNSMAEGEARIVYVGQDTSLMAYFLYKNPIKDHTKKYVEENYITMLQEIVGDKFFNTLDEFNKTVECEINHKALDEFSPDFLENLMHSIGTVTTGL